jgi:hypothetical protein
MRRFIPTPSMLVALIALFVSLGGVSYGVATGFIDSRELKNNTVSTKDLRNNDVRSGDVRNNGLTGTDINENSLGKVPSASTADSATTATTATNATNAGALAGIAAGAFQQKPRWAELDDDGTVLFQSGGISLTSHSTGIYVLDFGADVTGKLVLATPARTNREIIAVPCGGGPGATNCATGNDANHLLVRTENSAGVDTDARFYVAVFP